MPNEIELIEIKDFKPTKSGKYLVKSKTKYTGYRYLTILVKVLESKYTLDINNQEVILISKNPIINQ